MTAFHGPDSNAIFLIIDVIVARIT